MVVVAIVFAEGRATHDVTGGTAPSDVVFVVVVVLNLVVLVIATEVLVETKECFRFAKESRALI